MEDVHAAPAPQPVVRAHAAPHQKRKRSATSSSESDALDVLVGRTSSNRREHARAEARVPDLVGGDGGCDDDDDVVIVRVTHASSSNRDRSVCSDRSDDACSSSVDDLPSQSTPKAECTRDIKPTACNRDAISRSNGNCSSVPKVCRDTALKIIEARDNALQRLSNSRNEDAENDAGGLTYVSGFPVAVSVTRLCAAFFARDNHAMVAERIVCLCTRAGQELDEKRFSRLAQYRAMIEALRVRLQALPELRAPRTFELEHLIEASLRRDSDAAAQSQADMRRILEWRCGHRVLRQAEVDALEARFRTELLQFDSYASEVCQAQHLSPFRASQYVFTGAPDVTCWSRVCGLVDMQWRLRHDSAVTGQPLIVLTKWLRTSSLNGRSQCGVLATGICEEPAVCTLPWGVPTTQQFELELCVQRHILETYYGVVVVQAEAVAFHPDLPTYDRVLVQKPDRAHVAAFMAAWSASCIGGDVALAAFARCHQRR